MSQTAALAVCLALGCGGPPISEPAAGGYAGKAEQAEQPEGQRDQQPRLLFGDAYLQCFDGSVEIGIYAGHVQESSIYMQPIEIGTGNAIEINVPGDRLHSIDTNVFIITDGAGNDAFQVYYVRSSGLELVIDLYYDHEEGFLRGYYALPNYRLCNTAAGERELIEGFGPTIDLTGEAMNCYDYTFGDL